MDVNHIHYSYSIISKYLYIPWYPKILLVIYSHSWANFPFSGSIRTANWGDNPKFLLSKSHAFCAENLRLLKGNSPFLTVKSCFRWNPIFPREIHMFQVKFEFLRKISLFPHLARSESRSAEVFAHWKGRHRGRGIIRCPAGCSGGVDGVVVRSSEFSKVIFMR